MPVYTRGFSSPGGNRHEWGQAMTVGAFWGTTRRAVRKQAGRGVAVALGLATAFALTACQTNHKVPVASAADLPAPPTIAEESAAEAASAPVPAAADVTAAETAALPVDDVAAEADVALAAESFETADPADPDEVMGLGRKAVQAMLGAPGLVRREAPAEVWQYQSGGCVLDVFLYEASSDFQVVYLEARTGQALNVATASCLGAVLDRRRSTPSS